MVPHLKLASHAARQSWRKLLLPASRHNEVCEKWSLVSERPGFPHPGAPQSPMTAKRRLRTYGVGTKQRVQAAFLGLDAPRDKSSAMARESRKALTERQAHEDLGSDDPYSVAGQNIPCDG